VALAVSLITAGIFGAKKIQEEAPSRPTITQKQTIEKPAAEPLARAPATQEATREKKQETAKLSFEAKIELGEGAIYGLRKIFSAHEKEMFPQGRTAKETHRMLVSLLPDLGITPGKEWWTYKFTPHAEPRKDMRGGQPIPSASIKVWNDGTRWRAQWEGNVTPNKSPILKRVYSLPSGDILEGPEYSG